MYMVTKYLNELFTIYKYVFYRWGCEHERTARDVYAQHNKNAHDTFVIAEAGFFVNPQYPHLGASPDGLVSCNCCGEGVLEIKCPHCLSDKNANELNDHKSFCLSKNENGILQLKRDHLYFYQIQTQLHVCEKTYCDFVVWGKDFLHIERVFPDSDFWDVCVQKSSAFYIKGILPEILGKWFTIHTKSEQNNKSVDMTKVVCMCRKIEQGTMLECMSGVCKIQKFHLSCLKLKNIPKKSWSCPDCRKVAKSSKK